MQDFLTAAADWADHRHVDVKFARDESDGWFAIIHLSDARGTFSRTVDAIERGSREPEDKYRDRVFALMSDATVKARAARIMHNTRRGIAARAA
jgi:hypothetical protein